MDFRHAATNCYPMGICRGQKDRGGDEVAQVGGEFDGWEKSVDNGHLPGEPGGSAVFPAYFMK